MGTTVLWDFSRSPHSVHRMLGPLSDISSKYIRTKQAQVLFLPCFTCCDVASFQSASLHPSAMKEIWQQDLLHDCSSSVYRIHIPTRIQQITGFLLVFTFVLKLGVTSFTGQEDKGQEDKGLLCHHMCGFSMASGYSICLNFLLVTRPSSKMFSK